MNIRFILPLITLVGLSGSALSAEVPARLLMADGKNTNCLLQKFNKGVLSYHLNKVDQRVLKAKLSELDGVYFFEPKVYTEAMQLFNEAKYAEAKKKFSKCEKDYALASTIKGNYASLAGYYKLECSRRLFDFTALASDQKNFKQGALTREVQLEQLELNSLWATVSKENWEAVLTQVDTWYQRKLTGGQLAQVTYCHALALDKLSATKPEYVEQALNQYNAVLIADFSASSELVIQSVENALNIYLADKEVQVATKAWKSKTEDKQSAGYDKLVEANALANLYKVAGYDRIKPLDAKHSALLKYAPPKK